MNKWEACIYNERPIVATREVLRQYRQPIKSTIKNDNVRRQYRAVPIPIHARNRQDAVQVDCTRNIRSPWEAT